MLILTKFLVFMAKLNVYSGYEPLVGHVMCRYILPVGRFILLVVAFAAQKLFSLMWLHMVIFAFGVKSK